MHCPRPARRSSTWFNAVADDPRVAQCDRRRAGRRCRAAGLIVHDDLYNTAKRLVTKLILRAKVAYFSTMIVQCSFSRQLFHVTNRPVDRKKPQVLPSCYPLVELPSALLTIFFLDKIRAARINRDSQAPEPHSTESVLAKEVSFLIFLLSTCNGDRSEILHYSRHQNTVN